MQTQKIRKLTKLALLSAIIIIMAFTPLGYLRMGIIEITFIMIPVAIGAVLLGPKAGAILGTVFGLTSFAQAFSSAFGAILLAASPVKTFILCVVTRAIVGFLVGLLFKVLNKIRRGNIANYLVASASAAIFNTILFVGTLGLLFKDTMLGMATESGLSLIGFLMTMITINSVIEIIACLVIGGSICKVIDKFK